MWPFSSFIRHKDEPEERSSDWYVAFKDLVTPVHSGAVVDQDSALSLPAVYKCVDLNAATIAALPIDVYAKRGDTRVSYAEPAWLRDPNPFQTTAEFIAMTQVSLDLDGNAFWLKAVDPMGRLVGLSVIAPTAVQPDVRDGQRVYFVSAQGGRQAYAATEIVHLRGLVMPGGLRGLSPIECAKQTIGIGLSAEQYGGQFFGSGATLSGIIETPGQMTQEQAERLQVAFTKRHGGISKSHAIGVLSGGAAWKPLSVTPEEAQFLATRRYSAVEIANLYGVPPELVSDAEGAKGYVTALSQRMRMWYLTGLLPRITRIEDALSGLLPRPAYVKFNTNALLRMEPAERVQFYQAAQLGQWMSRNEIRALEDMNPLDGGDEMLKSVQWQENQTDEVTG